jgi:hypothetical protein
MSYQNRLDSNVESSIHIGEFHLIRSDCQFEFKHQGHSSIEEVVNLVTWNG